MKLPDTIERIRPSIVQIRTVREGDSPTGVVLGTGFIVSPDCHVVTALHVVQGIDTDRLQVAFPGPDIDSPQLKMRASFVGTGGKVIDSSPEDDLALVEVPGATSLTFKVQIDDRIIETAPSVVRIRTTGVREGTALAVSGYPLNEPSLVTNAGVLATSFSLIEGSGAGYQERYLGDFTANPGNSGGPVYTVDDGAVVGVCIGAKLAPIVGGVGAHAAGLTVIVPAAALIGLLDRNSLERPEPHSVRPRPSGKRRR